MPGRERVTRKIPGAATLHKHEFEGQAWPWRATDGLSGVVADFHAVVPMPQSGHALPPKHASPHGLGTPSWERRFPERLRDSSSVQAGSSGQIWEGEGGGAGFCKPAPYRQVHDNAMFPLPQCQAMQHCRVWGRGGPPWGPPPARAGSPHSSNKAPRQRRPGSLNPQHVQSHRPATLTLLMVLAFTEHALRSIHMASPSFKRMDLSAFSTLSWCCFFVSGSIFEGCSWAMVSPPPLFFFFFCACVYKREGGGGCWWGGDERQQRPLARP